MTRSRRHLRSDRGGGARRPRARSPEHCSEHTQTLPGTTAQLSSHFCNAMLVLSAFNGVFLKSIPATNWIFPIPHPAPCPKYDDRVLFVPRIGELEYWRAGSIVILRVLVNWSSPGRRVIWEPAIRPRTTSSW